MHAENYTFPQCFIFICFKCRNAFVYGICDASSLLIDDWPNTTHHPIKIRFTFSWMGHCVITCKDVKQGRTLVLGLALYESKHTHTDSLTVAGITSVCCSSQMFRPILKFVCVNFFYFFVGWRFFSLSVFSRGKNLRKRSALPYDAAKSTALYKQNIKKSLMWICFHFFIIIHFDLIYISDELFWFLIWNAPLTQDKFEKKWDVD